MPAASVPARDRLLTLLGSAVEAGTFVKLTLGKYRGADTTLKNLFVRPVRLKAGPQLSFVWRHNQRDITKNHPTAEALIHLGELIGGDFLDAHLFTLTQTAQLECRPEGPARLSIKATVAPASTPGPAAEDRAPASLPVTAADPSNAELAFTQGPETSSADEGLQGRHDRVKTRLIPNDAPWLRALGVTNERGQPREGMASKLRQIQRFVELLATLASEARLAEGTRAAGLRIADMGCGKGYLTFATSMFFGPLAQATGIESRPELVALCNRVAEQTDMRSLTFSAGEIATVETGPLDVLIALHACDTATDDALAKGIAAGARLLVVSPCCQKELRPQLTPPPVLADALRNGIFQERQAEFVTDALRAMLLEWAGFNARVSEFVSTEHTARNLMISAVKANRPVDPALTGRIRDLAAFFGITRHRLATHLRFPLAP